MTLRIVILCTIISLFTGRTFGQTSEKIDYFKKAEKYRRMKNTGMGLTVVGSVLLIVGTVTVLNSTVDELFFTDSKSTDAGAASMIVGEICLGGGIPLWIVGANNHKKYSKQAQQLNVKINANSRGQGLTFTYRF